MIIIIDAYNFLKAINHHKNLGDQVIKLWIDRFNQYVKLRGNDIILVFDAGPFSTISKEPHGLVQVIYAGQASSADAFIQDWISKNSELDVLLVTSDREIRMHAHRHDVVSISAQEFYAIFQDIMLEQEQEQNMLDQSMVKTKLSNESDDKILDQLLELSTRNLVVDYSKNEYNEDGCRLRNAAKKSKKDRTVLKKIEKI